MSVLLRVCKEPRCTTRASARTADGDAQLVQAAAALSRFLHHTRGNRSAQTSFPSLQQTSDKAKWPLLHLGHGTMRCACPIRVTSADTVVCIVFAASLCQRITPSGLLEVGAAPQQAPLHTTAAKLPLAWRQPGHRLYHHCGAAVNRRSVGDHARGRVHAGLCTKAGCPWGAINHCH